MELKQYLYWERFETQSDMIFSFFDIGWYRDNFMFIHVGENFHINPNLNDEISQKFDKLSDYLYPISRSEEDMILDGMGINGKRQYAEILREYGLGDEYRLYAFTLTPESVKMIINLFESALGYNLSGLKKRKFVK